MAITSQRSSVQEEPKQEVHSCTHCGEPCQPEDIEYKELHFCCQGCQLVYQLLQESGLDTSDYLLNTKRKAKPGQFDFLTEPSIAVPLVDFDSPTHTSIRLQLPAVHCSSCVYILENLPRFAPGLISVRLHFGRKEADIHFNPEHISLPQVAELLDGIGYTPVFKQKKQQEGKTQQERAAHMRLIVAAVIFGNVMLLSFPEYLGLEEGAFAQFFSWLNIALCLPLVFYASVPFFTSAWKGLSKRFLNIDVPIALGIIALFTRTLWEVSLQIGPGYADSLAGLIFFLLLGRWFQNKTYESLAFDRDYTAYFPLSVLRRAAGEERAVPIQELHTGDEIIVRNEEIIPADAHLISAGAQIDYSFVTGEDKPEPAKEGDLVYAGGRQLGGRIALRVHKAPSQSYLTSLWNQEAFTKPREQARKLLINEVSRYFTPAVLLIASIAAAGWALVDLHKAPAVFTAVLIVACPCALALAAPFTNGFSLRFFGKQQLYLKNAEVAELMPTVDAIVFDKTGTMTDSRQRNLHYDGEPLTDQDWQVVAGLAANSTHPLSQQIYTYLQEMQAGKLAPEAFEEHKGKGTSGYYKGQRYQLGSASWLGLAAGTTATGRVYLAIGGTVRGAFIWHHDLRPGIAQLIEALSDTHQLHVLSGDQEQDRSRLEAVFPSGTPMHFRQKPEDKLQYIANLQAQGQRVMMIGDGLNDAGALQQSDIGLAVTDDIAAFSPACDGILSGMHLPHLHRYLAYARQARKVIKWSFVLSFAYNLIGLSLAVSGLLTPIAAAILMPLSSVSVVLLATLASRSIARKTQALCTSSFS